MLAVASSRCNNRISRSTGSTLNQARPPVSQLLRRASRSCSLNVRPSDMGRSSLSLLFGTQRPGSPPCESLRLLVCCRFLSGGGGSKHPPPRQLRGRPASIITEVSNVSRTRPAKLPKATEYYYCSTPHPYPASTKNIPKPLSARLPLNINQ